MSVYHWFNSIWFDNMVPFTFNCCSANKIRIIRFFFCFCCYTNVQDIFLLCCGCMCVCVWVSIWIVIIFCHSVSIKYELIFQFQSFWLLFEFIIFHHWCPFKGAILYKASVSFRFYSFRFLFSHSFLLILFFFFVPFIHTNKSTQIVQIVGIVVVQIFIQERKSLIQTYKYKCV